jgi:hypothetical protein
MPTGAARLHLKTDAPLWFAAVLHDTRFYEGRDPSAKPFRLVLRRVRSFGLSLKGSQSPLWTDVQAWLGRVARQIPTDAATVDAASIMQSYASMLERVVLDHPEQYLWFHDLWRDVPPPILVD